MKIYILLIFLAIGFLFNSCKENPKSKTTLEEKESQLSIEKIGDLLNLENEDAKNNSSEITALKKLLENSNVDFDKSDGNSSLENLFSTKTILDLLEASGISRSEMEKLISNPDSLRVLAQKARKNRQEEQERNKKTSSKGKLSYEQLTSKNTSTGVSLEEAIRMVQAESGPAATMAKLKKIDSLAGTNVMEQMDLTEAGYVLSDIERKNEIKASPQEEQAMESLRKRSGQLHSDIEAKQLLDELEKMEKEIASGAIKVSPKYERTIEQQRKNVKIFHNDFIRKAKAAKKKFYQLNPDLYFGEEVGVTYIGHMKKAVYLPLGKLSFADKVVKATHPQLMTQQVNNVIGEPDVIKGFLAEDITGIHSLGLGGELIIQFVDNALTNVKGPDLYIFEIGQIEPTNLEISKDGKTWIKVGKIDGGVAEVDIEKYVKQGDLFYYVRLKDLKTKSGLPGADVDAIAAIGAAMRLNLDSKVLFDSGESELKPSGIEALKVLASSIEVLKSGRVIVEGHTDDIGNHNANQKLSLARAKSVSAELRKLIPSSAFKWQEKGLGESKPLMENNSDANRSKNRRVEILVLPH
ncbi:MAG: hypothetical protein Sapg2KO_48290 [Saprospiraceae bacterium]